MAANFTHSPWKLARRQYGVVAHEQLEGLGLTRAAIRHRLERGRLHELWPRVYAVGRREVSQKGRWFGAVLACRPQALLSHRSAAALWGIAEPGEVIDVSVPASCTRARRAGIQIHRRKTLPAATTRLRIPVTTPVDTLVDLAAVVSPADLPWAVRQADVRNLVDPETLRAAIDADRRPGAATLRRLLDRETFRLTDSELERLFLPLAAEAGLILPETGARPCGFKADFFWPAIGLIVETDSLRYHRTPTQQLHDRRRDQAHTAAGFTTLRFTHWQVCNEAAHVVETLAAVAARLYP